MKKQFSLAILSFVLAFPVLVHANTLSGSVVDFASGPVNLSAQGTVDWIHFTTAIEEKSGATGFSSSGNILPGAVDDFSPAGHPDSYTYNGDAISSVWTNGSPDAAGSDNYGIGLRNQGGSFTYTAPTTGAFTLTAYLGGFDSDAVGQQTLTATLPGATTYTDSFTAPYGNVFYTNAYTLNFTATAGDALTLTWNPTGGGAIQGQDFVSATISQVPEPSTWAMFFLGTGVSILLARRKFFAL